MTRMVQCIKLDKAWHEIRPLPNELGKRIFDNVSQEAWDAWTRHQTMLINENRLSLADPRARQYLAQQMESYFWRGRRPCARLHAAGIKRHTHHAGMPRIFLCVQTGSLQRTQPIQYSTGNTDSNQSAIINIACKGRLKHPSSDGLLLNLLVKWKMRAYGAHLLPI